ncbi:LamG-like jellyroll fold domain-containing protein [Mucisphaera sp.]|uniref:LamG-like jellyroll fold domain-containing protein n=1 Tax=Mucisphaera sp. TaxID=2913024 RepID=UPI003D12B356
MLQRKIPKSPSVAGLFVFVVASSVTDTWASGEIAIDGVVDTGYGAPVAVQTTQTGFGDANPPGVLNGSELNAAYVSFDDTYLNLMLTGNLEPNFNGLSVFIDSKPGGENTLSATPDYDSLDGTTWISSYLNGLTFDTGFSADYHVVGYWGNPNGPFIVDFYDRQGGTNSMIPGSRGVATPVTSLAGTGTITAGSLSRNSSGAALTVDMPIAINNNNTAGVLAGSGIADQTEAAAVTTGVELAIPLADIGNPQPGQDIRVFAGISNLTYNFWSNQFLGGLGTPGGNLGGDGNGNSIGDSSGIDFSSIDGDQFFTVTVPLTYASSKQISLDPTRTYLRRAGFDLNTPDAIPVSLAGLGIEPGDRIELGQLGDYALGASFDDDQTALGAVFASSPDLGPPENQFRVTAVQPSEQTFPPFNSFRSFSDNGMTDIGRDFLVTANRVVVPAGATHLFLTPNDSGFADNVDPDGDYGVSITLAPPPRAIGVYAFEGDVSDASGSEPDGFLAGSAGYSASGFEGQALQLNGNSGPNDAARIFNNLDPNLYPRLTMGAWVKAASTSQRGTIISHDDGSFDRSIVVDPGSGGGQYSAFGGNGAPLVGSLTAPPGNDWVFVAAVYDNVLGQTTFYLDDQSAFANGSFVGPGDPFSTLIGRNPNFGQVFDGLIDNVFIYDDALTPQEIETIRLGGIAELTRPDPLTFAVISTDVFGPEDNFTDISQWNIGQIPNNTSAEQFRVKLSGGGAVRFNTGEVLRVGELDMSDTGFAFSFGSNQPFTVENGSSLTVEGSVRIARAVTVSGPGSELEGTSINSGMTSGAVLRALDGGRIELGIERVNIRPSGLFLEATGSGSIVSLPNLKSMAFQDYRNATAPRIIVDDGGRLELGQLLDLTAFQTTFRRGPRAKLDVLAGSEFYAPQLQATRNFDLTFSNGRLTDLPALARIESTSTSNSSSVRSDLHVAGVGTVVNLPALTQIDADVLVTDGAVLQMPLVTDLTQIGRSFTVDTGGQLLLDQLTTLPSSLSVVTIGTDGSRLHTPDLVSIQARELIVRNGLVNSYPLVTDIANLKFLTLSGEGTTFELPAVTSAPELYDVELADGSTLNLSNVTSIGATISPITYSAVNGSTINLSNLPTYSTNESSSQLGIIASDNSSIDLGSVTTVSSTNARLPISATLNSTIDLGAATTISGADLLIGTGSSIDLSGLSGLTNTTLDYHGGQLLNLSNIASITGDPGGVVLRSQGAGSFLTLSGISTLNLSNLATLEAAAGAVLNLPLVTSANSTFTNGRLQIRSTNGGEVRTPSLSDLTWVNLIAEDATLAFPQVGSWNFIVDTSRNSFDLQREDTVLLADGASALIDLSNVTEVRPRVGGGNLSTGGAGFAYIEARNGGVADLSDTATIAVTDASPAFGPGVVRFTAASGGTIRFDSLTSATANRQAENLQFVIDGGTMTFPQLDTVQRATFDVRDGSALDLTSLSVFDEAGAKVSGGSQVMLGIDSYAIDGADSVFSGGVGRQKPFESRGVASVLEFPNLTSFSASLGSGGAFGGPSYVDVEALDGGTIDMPELLTISMSDFSSFEPSQLTFKTTAGSSLLMPKLQTISVNNEGVFRNVIFDIGSSGFDLSALTQANGTVFQARDGVLFEVPSLTSLTGGGFAAQNGSTTRANSLTTTLNVDFEVFGTGVLELSALQDISGASFFARDGGSLEIPNGISSYFADAESSAPDADRSPQFIAEGVGSVLDLTSLQSMTMILGSTGLLGSGGSAEVRASSGGLVDLSELTSVDISLRSSFNDPAPLNVTAQGGEVRLGRIVTESNVFLLSQGAGSVITIPGMFLKERLLDEQDVPINSTGQKLSLLGGGRLRINDQADTSQSGYALEFNHVLTVDDSINLQDGVLEFSTGDVSYLEVAGQSLGVQVVDGQTFGIGRLEVLGNSEGLPTTLRLRDAFDNDADPQSIDSLYLYGLNGGEGLMLQGGSVLELSGISAYAKINGLLTELASLFPAGVQQIAFGGGFIRLNSTPTILGDFDGSGTLDAVDLDLLYTAIRDADTGLDLTSDGLIDSDDALEWVTGLFGSQPGDANLDRIVDLVDLSTLASNFGQSVLTNSQGDFNADGTVDLIDLSALASSFGFDGNAVPEPASAALLCMSALLLQRRLA